MDKLPDGYALCAACGVNAFQHSPKKAGRKFCSECSNQRDKERKKIWAREHPQEYDPIRAKRDAETRRALLVEAGAAASQGANIAWYQDCDPELGWIIRLTFPFSYGMSKNSVWRSVGAGHLILREEARAFRDEMTMAFKSAVAADSIEVVTNRVWLDIMVEKPDHRGDAINVVDLVADAVKDAIGVDDRWFSIRRLDWRVVKTDPKIYVGIGQEVDAVDSQVCSYCGNILPLDSFPLNRASSSGRGRTCKPCSKAARALKKRE